MKIFIEVTLTGIEKWETDWSDPEEVQLDLINVEEETRHALGERLGIGYRNVSVEATFESE